MKTGDPAPDFVAQDQDGEQVALSSFRGKRVVLWFYPKADTPGWTVEGRGFRDLHAEFTGKDVQILGASYDPPEANKAFKLKFTFPFPLLSDSDKAIAKAYGAFDAAHEGYPSRNTYVIGPEGTIEQVLEGVDPATHPKALLDSLK